MAHGPSAQGAAQMKESEAGSLSLSYISCLEFISIQFESEEKMNLESFLNYVAFNKKAFHGFTYVIIQSKKACCTQVRFDLLCVVWTLGSHQLLRSFRCTMQYHVYRFSLKAPVQTLDLSDASADKANAEAPNFAFSSWSFSYPIVFQASSCTRFSKYQKICCTRAQHRLLMFLIKAQMVLRGALNFKRVDVAKARHLLIPRNPVSSLLS